MYKLKFLKNNNVEYLSDKVDIGNVSISLHDKLTSHISIWNDEGVKLLVYGTSLESKFVEKSILNIDGLNIAVIRLTESYGYIFAWNITDILAGAIVNDIFVNRAVLDFRPDSRFIRIVRDLVLAKILPKKYLTYMKRTSILEKFPASAEDGGSNSSSDLDPEPDLSSVGRDTIRAQAMSYYNNQSAQGLAFMEDDEDE